ncbi:MAG: signal peptidase I [candidate division Zixibacteria bacterium]
METDFLIQEHTKTQNQRDVRSFTQKKERKPIWREYVETAVIALVAAILLRIFVVSAYRVNSGSMADSLYEGDYIFVNKLAYDFGTEPVVGDIVVFRYPNNPKKQYIKRIVAGPGSKVEVADKIVYVDDLVAQIPPHSKNIDQRIIPGDLSFRDNFAPFVVPPGEFFVMGDNRDDSRDSRFWGGVPVENVIGKAVFVYWSWQPDNDPPGWGFPYVVDAFQWIGHGLYNFPTHIRWERLGTSI